MNNTVHPSGLNNAVYISGPMHGRAQFNIPLFDRAALALRRRGWLHVISPSELDDAHYRHECLLSEDGRQLPAGGPSWGDLLARDVKLIANNCDGLVLLEGWDRSRGARLEVMCALMAGITHFWRYYDDVEDVLIYDIRAVKRELAQSLVLGAIEVAA